MRITESENAELSVKPFDNQHKRSSILHPDLLHPPFSLLLVGPKGSGKGNCTLRLIFGNQKKKGTKTGHHKFYRHYFDKIYVFSPTWELDPKMRRCHIPTDQIFSEPDMYTEVISEILEGQVEDIEEEGKEDADDILLIFSDLAGHKTFADSKGIMNRLAFNHRHYNVSIIIDTQSLRQINNAFRNNLSGIILFAGINNRLELKKIYEEYLGAFTPKEATALLNYVFDSPYNFLFINFQKPKGRRFHKNFNRLRIEGTTMA
jgi:hypothetical protein